MAYPDAGFTPIRVTSGARAIPTRGYDLSVTYKIGMASWLAWNDPAYQIWMTHTPGGTVVDNASHQTPEMNRRIAYSGDGIQMYTHCGTHLDTLNHFGYGDEIWNGFKVSEH